jgi:opacity protein-like surface antigen
VYFGGELVKNSGRVRSTETRAATDVVTNQFTDSGDPIGGGAVVGYNFSPWGDVIVGPFASFDWLNQTINHTFAGGTFLGTTTHWMITAGAKGGVTPAPGFFVYGLAGVSWLNQDLNINFGGPVTSSNTTVPGFTFGLGGEYKPSFLQGFGVPVAVFAQYQHTWWQDGTLTTPAASPLFNYAFRREDDTFKVGFNVYFGAPQAAEPMRSPMLVKALPAK